MPCVFPVSVQHIAPPAAALPLFQSPSSWQCILPSPCSCWPSSATTVVPPRADFVFAFAFADAALPRNETPAALPLPLPVPTPDFRTAVDLSPWGQRNWISFTGGRRAARWGRRATVADSSFLCAIGGPSSSSSTRRGMTWRGCG